MMPKTSTAPQPTPRVAQRRVIAAHALSSSSPNPARPRPVESGAQSRGASAPFQSKAHYVTRTPDSTLPGGRGLTFWGQWLVAIGLPMTTT